ncbi:hypothetical protein EAI_10786 [Harpegnathos saltator]|uniref:Uncharacterized protein n=1 Tax=Harpegnathos saltator TaxID=610380 RepID=E2BVK1_HARSA|nr:hypothetical protein EAI_10786 [Harpegnathos saltator]
MVKDFFVQNDLIYNYMTASDRFKIQSLKLGWNDDCGRLQTTSRTARALMPMRHRRIRFGPSGVGSKMRIAERGRLRPRDIRYSSGGLLRFYDRDENYKGSTPHPLVSMISWEFRSLEDFQPKNVIWLHCAAADRWESSAQAVCQFARKLERAGGGVSHVLQLHKNFDVKISSFCWIVSRKFYPTSNVA